MPVEIFVHIFYDGSSNTFSVSDFPNADIGDISDSDNVIRFAESALSLPDGTLRNFVVDRTDSDISVNFTVRPSEVFG